jgi:hypothetical protein
MRKLLKRLFGIGLLAGIAYALWRAWSARVPRDTSGVGWETAPFPFPPVPRPASTSSTAGPPPAPSATRPAAEVVDSTPWIEPNGDGTCPATHPVKAKVRSGIYHEPGGANYDRTKPDRCYVDAAAAEADGLRHSKV